MVNGLNILIVEDDPLLADGLKFGLEQMEHNILLANSVEDAYLKLYNNEFDILIIDLGLPDGDGNDIVKTLRKNNNKVPIIILTARNHRQNQIISLDLGADDYVTKPYDIGELGARIRALHRRINDNFSSKFILGECEFDTTSQTLVKNGELIKCTRREIKLLSYLLAKANSWVSKSDIEAYLYDDSTSVESNTIETIIYSLRKKLGANTIISARGIGYMVNK